MKRLLALLPAFILFINLILIAGKMVGIINWHWVIVVAPMVITAMMILAGLLIYEFMQLVIQGIQVLRKKTR